MEPMKCPKCGKETPRLWDNMCPNCYRATGKPTLRDLENQRKAKHSQIK